ncbi:phage tail assembly chaperone [Pararhizobium sp.]|uniref:phage tail assembly chaperone n=1 Tax=Pararhizobium sp. TaxID=1977563 RepID=UPI003D0B0C14
MRMLGQMVEALCSNLRDGGRPRLPAGGELYWQWFVDLHRARTWHMGGPNAISYVDIESYSRVMRWPLQPHHVEVITAMDQAFLSHYAATHAPAGDGTKPAKQRPAGDLAPTLFDAIFPGG